MEHTQKRDLFFGSGRKVIHTSAPGRLDIIGGIGDFCGSMVLAMPLKERTHAFVALRDDQLLRIHDTNAHNYGLKNEITIPIGVLFNSTADIDYGFARDKIFKHGEASRWAIYIVGCFLVMARERHIQLQGADVWIDSEIPFGRGVASSAAIEIAVLKALSQLYNLSLDKQEIPICAQKVENLVVGSPCGIMDQLTAYLGQTSALLPIRCQPANLLPPLPLPEGLHFVGLNSGVKHLIGTGNYPKVRTTMFMGYTIIAKASGATQIQLQRAKETGRWGGLPFRGYLANIDTKVFQRDFAKLLPEKITGQNFIDTYQHIIDPLSQIDPAEIYHVKTLTSVPIIINNRATSFYQIFEQISNTSTFTEEQLLSLGKLMNQAHQGFTNLELGNPHTNQLVDALKEAGTPKGIYGAKASAAGQGGTVIALCKGQQGIDTAAEVLAKYAQNSNLKTGLFTGSSDGAFFEESKALSF